LSAFRAWFENFDSDYWDRQFEEDAKTGALDAAVKEAVEEYGNSQIPLCIPKKQDNIGL